MTSYPKISIITPAFNSAKMLPRAIDSLIAQDYPNLEYLLMDGGSTDGTLDIIRRYEPHISYWQSQSDQGAPDACNQGFQRATGDIIAMLNSDDWYEPGILKAVGDAFLKHPDAAVVTCEVRLVRGTSERLEVLHEFKGRDLAMDGTGSLIINGRFFRREIFDRHGFFMLKDRHNNNMIAVDLDFMLRLFIAGEKNIILPRLGYTYFAHDRSYTFSGSRKMAQLLHRQRGEIAAQFLLRSDVPAHLRRRLKRWHTLGSTRDFLAALKERKWQDARTALGQGMRIQPLYWPLYLAKISTYKLLRIPK